MRGTPDFLTVHRDEDGWYEESYDWTPYEKAEVKVDVLLRVLQCLAIIVLFCILVVRFS